MQEERRYTLGKYVFNTENEYNDAKKDLQLIRQLKDKYNVEDRDIAMKIIKAVELKKVIFHSKIGEDFVRYLVKNIKAEEDILGRISGESEEERTRNIVREELENHQSPINLKSFWKKKLAAKEKLITNDKYSIKYIEEYVYLVVEFLLFAMLFSAWGMASMSYDYGSDPIECYPYGVIWLLAIRVLPIVSFATLVGYIRGMIKNHHCWNRNVYCSQYISIWIYTVGAFIYKNIFSDVYKWKNAWKVITNKEYLEAGRYYNLIYNGQWDPEYGILEATLLFAWILLLPVGRMILGIVKWIYKCVQKRIPALEGIIPVFMVNPLKRKKLFILLYIVGYFVLFAFLYAKVSAMLPSDTGQNNYYYSGEETKSYQEAEKKNMTQETLQSIGWELDIKRIAKVLNGTISFEEIQKEKPEAVIETIKYETIYQTELVAFVNKVEGRMIYSGSYEGEFAGLMWEGKGLSEQGYVEVIGYVSKVAKLDKTASDGNENTAIYVWNNEVDVVVQDYMKEIGIVKLYFKKHIRRSDSVQNTNSKEIILSVNQKELALDALIEIMDFGLSVETVQNLLGEADYQEGSEFGVHLLSYYDCFLNDKRGTLTFNYGEYPNVYWNSESGFDGYQELVDASRRFGEVERQTTYDIEYKYNDRSIRISQKSNGYELNIEPYINWDEMWLDNP